MRNDNTDNTFTSLKDKVNATTDDLLADDMQARWEKGDFPDASFTAEQEAKLKSRILSAVGLAGENGTANGRSAVVIKYFIRVSAVLIPLLVLSTGWLLYDRVHHEPAVAVVETGFGEKTTVSLPDGSTVRLNYNTRLSYDPVAFQRSARSVTIDGEAMFKVAKNASRPFTVDARGLRVSVLGTVFNLRSRQGERRATVVLEEGSVNLCSTVSGEQATLQPVEKATLDYETNSIKVINTTKNDAATAWQRGELKFDDERLAVVLSTIEGCYGVKFVDKSSSSMLNDRFSGTLPSADLNEVLDILEHTYNVSFDVKDKKIKIIRKVVRF